MNRVAATGLALFFAIAPTFAASRHFTLRVHALGNENDGEVFASAVTLPISRRNVFIEKVPMISERDVVAAQVYPAANGTFAALFQLDDHGRLALEQLSIEHRGSTLLVMANGRAVTEFLVDRRVSDGLLYLPGGLTAEEAQRLGKEWPRLGEKKRR